MCYDFRITPQRGENIGRHPPAIGTSICDI